MDKIKKGGYYRKINIFFGVNVHKSFILAKSSSNGYNPGNADKMGVFGIALCLLALKWL